MQQLTKAEEDIMQILWRLKKAYVKDIIAEMDDPKPAYNTVSTIVRILQDKGIINHESVGRSHRYFPILQKEAYSKYTASKLISNYFGGSVSQLVSFFVKDEKLSVADVEGLINELKNMKDD